MSHTQHTVAGAIARSASHDEIVTVIVEDIEAAFAELKATMPDDGDYDYVDTRGQDDEPLREVWDASSDDGSMGWRVHLIQRA